MKSSYSNFDSPTQIAEKRKQNREKEKALTMLKIVCNNYSVFIRSDEFNHQGQENSDEAIEKQCSHIEVIALAAMEVYHPGAAEFIKLLEKE